MSLKFTEQFIGVLLKITLGGYGVSNSVSCSLPYRITMNIIDYKLKQEANQGAAIFSDISLISLEDFKQTKSILPEEKNPCPKHPGLSSFQI